MRNKKDAKNAVMGIAKEYGFIEKEIMNQMAPNVRLAVEESMLARDKKSWPCNQNVSMSRCIELLLTGPI